MLRDRMTPSITGLAAGALLTCACLAEPTVEAIETKAAPADDRAALINDRMGLARSTVLQLDVQPHEHMIVPLVVQGLPVLIDLQPHSVRSDKFQLMVDIGGGRLLEVQPGPTRTVRGEVLGFEGATVAGSLLDDGLHLRIALPWGDELWLEPLAGRIADAALNEYVLYDSLDVLETNHACGIESLPDALAHRMLDPNRKQEPTPINNGISVAELAADADFEYYTAWGSSVQNVANRIESIVNTVNGQYEGQVAIRHELTTIIVRTSSSQPYTQTRADQLLNQFRNQWNANHGNISRDVAHLFTGKNIQGGTIGIAWVGVICNLSYAYGLSQSDFNGNYASATDLTAHELGHNWNAGHCSCPQHTMNASITSANNFHPTATIPVITQFRNSRTCLSSGNPTPGYGACCMAGCFQTDQASCTALGGTFPGVGTACADSPCGCPAGTIPDCNGNCAPANWVGDGICDNGAYSYNGVPIYFNCAQFNCDGGDCQCDDDPPPGGDPTSLSVAAINATTVNVGQGNRIGRAQVTIRDNNGNPVQGATVTGNFTGSYNETRSGTTNAQGVATIDTVATQKGNVSFTFCVTNVTHGSLSYNANGNSVTCASN